MYRRAEDMLSPHHSIDEGLERLRRDVLAAEGDTDEATFEEPVLDFAKIEFEVERMRKRLHIWDIFVRCMKDGARTWADVQRAMTPEDLDEIAAICDGIPLRDVLLDG